MDFNEVKDPAGVTALLDQLRASQAWQQTISSNTATSKTTGPEVYQSNKEATEPKADNNPTSATVAALLSQLQAASSSDLDISSYASGNGGFSYVDASSSALTAPPARAADLRSCTFQQALAHISQLSQDVRVADTIRTVSHFVAMSFGHQTG
ncbi:hypothetical protein BC629DRAFT_707311 [Irpex lacteus]|nr:hypothetical protein BC629DRAFT_707311 [Irpex lacteus]